tara:strand:+ start:524 stop:733 length:210 start_codon:yes stop_codon:yes gene_type:complete
MIDTDDYERTTPELEEFEGETLGDTLTNLLAEVKRWHKVRDYILEKASYPTVKKLHLKDLLNFMEEVIE